MVWMLLLLVTSCLKVCFEHKVMMRQDLLTLDLPSTALSAASILMTTISRLAEEFVLWSSWEFRSITLDDGFAMVR